MEKNTDMKCYYCEMDNPEQARFCGSCGQKLVQDEGESPVTPHPLNYQSLSVSASIEQVGDAPAPSLAEHIVPEVQSATPATVGADMQQGEETTDQSSLSIWPFSGLNQESIKSYTPELELMPLSPPPGWPIFQEKKESVQEFMPIKAQSAFLTWLLTPWSRPAFYGAIAALTFVLLLLILTGSDWATGVAHAAILSAFVALLLMSMLGLHLMMGKVAQSSAKRRTQYISAGLVILVLLLFIGTALSFQPALHTLQARSLEQGQRWEQAIAEYQFGGDSAPTSANIARIYNEWGEGQAQKQQYQQAIGKFETVLNKYSRAGSQISRAQKNEIDAYINAGKQDQQKQDYGSAVAQFDALLRLNYCDAQCQKDNQPLAADAYYSLAKSQLVAAQYAGAVASFTTLQQRFSTSSAYQAAHGDMAKALFGLGLQEIRASECSSAVLNYQQLAKAFADTVQGKNAAVALKAPQSVKGHFTKPVPRGRVLAVLTQGVAARAWNKQFYQALAHHPLTATILANGTFLFKSVKQGTYDLSWGTIAANGNQRFSTGFLRSNPGVYSYVAHVGPLCSFDFGNITVAIPKSS